MFSRNSTQLAARVGVSTFAYFVKTEKKLKKLNGGALFKEGSKLYKALNKTQKKVLRAKALKVKVAPKKAGLEPGYYAPKPKKRVASAYARFVKSHFDEVNGATQQAKIRAIAKLWAQHKAKLANATKA